MGKDARMTDSRPRHRRSSRVLLGATPVIGIAIMLSLTAAATARSPQRGGPSPQKPVASSILIHNSFANVVQDEFAGPDSNYAVELESCRRVEAMVGEERSEEEKALRRQEEGNVKAAESLRDFNSRLPLWVRTFRGFGPRLPRAERGKLNGAVARLASAHTAHEHEFFDVKGIWVDIESVDCAGAEDMEHQAASLGTPAWTREFRALVEVAHLFHVTRPSVEYPVGPYLLEPVG
jgi:hypothetical protein